jgi:hypothetical protein
VIGHSSVGVHPFDAASVRMLVKACNRIANRDLPSKARDARVFADRDPTCSGQQIADCRLLWCLFVRPSLWGRTSRTESSDIHRVPPWTIASIASAQIAGASGGM